MIAPDVSSIDGRVEHSVWTWASSAATFAGAFVARVWLVVSPRQRLNAVAIVATLAYFSLDDMLELHEEVGSDVAERLALPDWVGGLWLLAYPPLLLIAVWALVGATWNERAKIRRAMLAGIALLGAGLVLELLGIATKRLQLDGTDLAARGPRCVRGGRRAQRLDHGCVGVDRGARTRARPCFRRAGRSAALASRCTVRVWRNW